jgi:O-succinylbenzoate synthase
MSRIDEIDVYRIRLPLVTPFQTAYGCDHAVEPVLVRMVSGERVGWGEAQAFEYPTYCPEYGRGVFGTIRDVLAPALIGHEIDSGDALQARLACFKGNPFAKGGLDMAWWDLHAHIRDEPLWRVLGGQSPTVEVGADFGVLDSVDELLVKIGEAIDAGYERVKLKYAPGWDIEMVKTVREAFPELVCHIDCNSAYTLDDLAMFKALDAFDLAMIEQPLMHDDLIDHATLARQIKTPICLDESITSPAKARKAIEIEAARWINIKPIRVGGLTPALAIHDLCQDAGLPCWVGGMVESGLGGQHCLAMATLPNVRYPCDIFPSERFFDPDLIEPGIVLSGCGRITARDAPGIGVEPDPQRLAELTTDHAKVTS